MKYQFEDDSHDTILLNKYSTNNNNNVENYITSSQNFLEILERSSNYFSSKGEIDKQFIDNKKNEYENQKKLFYEVQLLNDEYKKEKIKFKDLREKLNQKKLRENIYPNLTNNSDISPEDLKKNKEYISFLENSVSKLENEYNELNLKLNIRKHETENNSNNYEEEQYYKFFIKKEINRLKDLLSEFNNHTHNQFYLYNDLESNFTKESNQNNNDKSDKNLSFYENSKNTNTGSEYHHEEKIVNSNNNTNNNKYINQKNILIKKNDISNQNNNNMNMNNNKIINIERNASIISHEFIGNPTSHSGMNNNQKIKSKLNYGNLPNHNNKNNNFKSQRGGSKKKK